MPLIRSNYISQLPPEILTLILRHCVKWFKPQLRGRTPPKYDPDERAITRAIMCAVGSTCRYFRDVMKTVRYRPPPTSTSAFVLYNGSTFDNLFKIASRDFIRSIVRADDAEQNPLVASRPTMQLLATNLVNYVAEGRGPISALIDLRRIGVLRNYTYNSLGFITTKSPNRCYAARYKVIDDYYDLKCEVEGLPGVVAVRVVINWIKRTWNSRSLRQCDLDKALNLIIRTHPEHAHGVINYVLRMRSVCNRYKLASSRQPSCRFDIQDNELSLYAMYRGESEYCAWLMLRLSLAHRMGILASLPLAQDKYNAIMFNWEVPVCVELMEMACLRFNHILAQLCKKYCDCMGDAALRMQMNTIYSRHYCATSGACAANSIVVSGTNTCMDQTISSGSITATQLPSIPTGSITSGLCYTPCPSGYTRYTPPRSTITRCTCNCVPGTSFANSDVRDIAFISGVEFQQFGLYPNEYQPSGTVNFSKISEFNVPLRNDPAAKFIRYDSTPVSNGLGFGRGLNVSIPRYGDLIADATITMNFNDGLTMTL